jgi:hypothetical protein
MISTCILINYCILRDFKPPVDVSIEDVKRVQEMLCEYIPKEAFDRMGNLYSGAPWVYCDQKLETHSVFFSQVLLLEKPAWLAWLGLDTAWFSLFSHNSIQTSPDESNLKLDVILASLSINVILLYLPISVMWEYVCDVSLLWWLRYPESLREASRVHLGLSSWADSDSPRTCWCCCWRSFLLTHYCLFFRISIMGWLRQPEDNWLILQNFL